MVADGSGARTLDNVSLKIDRGETVAVIDNAGNGGEALAEALARIVWPVSGRVMLGDTDILELPESVSGRGSPMLRRMAISSTGA